MRLSFRAALAAVSAMPILALATAAAASSHPLVAGQTLSLPLNDESDGPTLKFVVENAVLEGGDIVPGEKWGERKARAGQVVLDNIDGRNLVKFVRGMAEELRARRAAAPNPASVTVSAKFQDRTHIAAGPLWGDALKAGFTFGIATPSTTPMIFVSHMDITVDGQTYTCDAEAPGRIPAYPRRDDPHVHDGADKMAEDARKACWAQISEKLGAALSGSPAAAEAPAPAPPASPAAAPAPAVGASSGR